MFQFENDKLIKFDNWRGFVRRRAQSPQGYYFFLDKKVIKKSRQQNASFAALGLCPANQAAPRLHIVALLRTRRPVLQQQNAMPFPAHKASMCCLLSPRSCLLAGMKEKAGKGLPEKRARVFCLWVEDFFRLDLFAIAFVLRCS